MNRHDRYRKYLRGGKGIDQAVDWYLSLPMGFWPSLVWWLRSIFFPQNVWAAWFHLGAQRVFETQHKWRDESEELRRLQERYEEAQRRASETYSRMREQLDKTQVENHTLRSAIKIVSEVPVERD